MKETEVHNSQMETCQAYLVSYRNIDVLEYFEELNIFKNDT